MTHFPQPHPERRAARVQLGGSVQAAIRSEDGERTRGKLQSISVTGGLLALGKPMDNGDFIEIAFQTRSGAVHGMAEMLNPTRELKDGCLQPFRFIALGDDDHRKLRMALDSVMDSNILGSRPRPFAGYNGL
jgi:hypothetical protein